MAAKFNDKEFDHVKLDAKAFKINKKQLLYFNKASSLFPGNYAGCAG